MRRTNRPPKARTPPAALPPTARTPPAARPPPPPTTKTPARGPPSRRPPAARLPARRQHGPTPFHTPPHHRHPATIANTKAKNGTQPTRGCDLAHQWLLVWKLSSKTTMMNLHRRWLEVHMMRCAIAKYCPWSLRARCGPKCERSYLRSPKLKLATSCLLSPPRRRPLQHQPRVN